MNSSPVFLKRAPLSWYSSEKRSFPKGKVKRNVSLLKLCLSSCVFFLCRPNLKLVRLRLISPVTEGKWSVINSFNFLTPWSQPHSRCTGAAFQISTRLGGQRQCVYEGIQLWLPELGHSCYRSVLEKKRSNHPVPWKGGSLPDPSIKTLINPLL